MGSRARPGRNGDLGYGRNGEPGYGNVFSTFFFSNFPHGFGETDMAKVFQKWARVMEVFISRRLNKWGRRFGFVRFLDVKNVVRLEGELDQIYIGNRKLHVIIPKYRRFQSESNMAERRTPRTHHMESQKEAWARPLLDEEGKGTERRKELWVEKKRTRTFVEVVIGASQEQWKGLSVKTHQHMPQWMINSFIGKLGEGMDFDKPGEEIMKGGMSMVRARYMGDNLVLLSPREGGAMENIMKLNKGWFESVFSSVSPWSFSSGASHRIVWVRCDGLPLPMWNKECFAKVIGELPREAAVVSIDEATLTWEVLEYARLQVRVQNAGSVRWARRIQINDHMCSILVKKEPNGCLGWGCKENLPWDDSSDSVSSSETYVEETAFSVRSGEEQNRLSCGDVRRSEGEEGGGEKVREGEHPWSKSTFPLLEPGKGGQGKGRISASKGARQGHKEQDESLSVISPGQVCGGACYSNPILHEAAKTVTDVECLINQIMPSEVVGLVNNLEAHSSKSGPNALA